MSVLSVALHLTMAGSLQRKTKVQLLQYKDIHRAPLQLYVTMQFHISPGDRDTGKIVKFQLTAMALSHCVCYCADTAQTKCKMFCFFQCTPTQLTSVN